MAYEIPLDLIKELQISLRKEANIPSYDPDDHSLPNLPSIDETIAEVDPSPPYLRCKDCKARLIRDLKSFICVFCGREQNTEVPPDPINFKNTIACRWLLESLELDGSEMVGLPADSKEWDRGKSPEQFPLSNLLDLEIKWPSESDKKEIGLSNETLSSSKSTLNLAGVDLDNFFSEEKKDTSSILADEPLPSNDEIDGSESIASQSNANVSLFEDFRPSEAATRTHNHESDDSFSGWEANFQSASSATFHNTSKSFDPFAGSVVNISSPLETSFGHQKQSVSGVEDDETLSSSMTNDWFQQQGDSLSNNPNHGTNEMPKQVEQTGNFIDGRAMDNADYASSENVDWFQDDQWQRGSKTELDDKSVHKNDAPADAWDDFTSLTSVQAPFDNSRKDIADEVLPNADEISEIDFFSTVPSKDNNMRNCSSTDLFAEAFSHPNGIAEEKVTQSDAYDLNRMGKESEKTGENSEGTIESLGTSNPSSNSDDAQMLMTKMHDLSFMLSTQLSIPPK